MILELARTDRYGKRCIGTLHINGAFTCYTLEDNPPLVPVGTYKITITYSPRFKKNLPILNNVPGHSGIRIHTGNSHEDTEGCILVGLDRTVDRILKSRVALDHVQHKIQTALDQKEEVLINIWTA